MNSDKTNVFEKEGQNKLLTLFFPGFVKFIKNILKYSFNSELKQWIKALRILNEDLDWLKTK